MRKYKEHIKIPNSDTATPEKEATTVKSISEFLGNLGESSAALYIENKLSPKNPYSKSMEKIEKERNKEIIKLSMVNSGILDKLDSIEKSLKKGQDTSINPVIKEAKQTTALQQVKEIQVQKTEENSGGWLEGLLGGLIGMGMLAFLKGFKNLGPVQFAMKLVGMGWDAIKDKIKSLVTGVAKTLIAPVTALIDWILEKLSKIPGFEDFGEKRKQSKADKAKETAKANKANGPDSKAKIDVTPDKLEKETAKQVAKGTSKTLTKKIPLIGLVAAGAFAIDRLLDGDAVGAGMELSSGILGTLGAVTFGAGTAGSFAVDGALMVRDIERAKSEIITKLDDEGIIDKSFFGDTTIEDWERINTLSIEDLKLLSEHEDLDKNDKTRLDAIIVKKELQKVKEPENLDDFNESGVKVLFNEREILADTLLESNNKLENFLMENPFTEENSVKKESTIDGEKVVEIKYKDEELNKKYLELKEEMDENFAKYKAARESQLSKIEAMYDIQGSTFTESEYDQYQQMKASGSNVTPVQYERSNVLKGAQEEVSGALNKNLENIQLPTGELVERIKKSEGLKLTQYLDTEGKPTIGYGHLIKPNEKHLMNATITKEQAEALFAKDFEEHKQAAMKIPSFNNHSKEIQDTLIDMTYNMGPAWYKGWPATIAALQKGDYETVKQTIINSKYASQVKGRALVNAKVFENEMSNTKMASNTVSTPNNTASQVETSKNNINILDKNNAIEQKAERAQNAEDINKNLVKNSSQAMTVNNYNNQQSSSKSAGNVEIKPLSSIFGTYNV